MTKKATSGTPEDPVDHSQPAGMIAAKVDPAGKLAPTGAVSPVSIDTAKKDERTEGDNTLDAKVRDSGLYFIRNHNTGRDYVGISPQNDPDSSEADKRVSSVTPLSSVAPRTGMQVQPKSGDAFSIGEGFGPNSTPADWAKVTSPDGKPLFG